MFKPSALIATCLSNDNKNHTIVTGAYSKFAKLLKLVLQRLCILFLIVYTVAISQTLWAADTQSIAHANIAIEDISHHSTLAIGDEAWEPNSTAVDYLLDKRESIAARWMGLIEQIDQVLAGDLYSENYSNSNKSYLNLSVNQSWQEDGELDTKIRIKTRIDLPHTKKRLRLLFDSEDERDETLESKILNKKTSELSDKTTDNTIFSTAALQWVLRQNKQIKESLSVGVRDFPKNPFIRFRSDFNYSLNNSLELNFDNSLYYAKEEKLYSKHALTFIKQLKADRTLINRSQIYWENDENSLESSNITTYQRVLDPSRRYSYSAGIGKLNSPELNTTNYFLRGVYSQRLYEDWLFMDVTPVVEFPSEENYDAKAALNIKFNILFK